MTDTPISTTRMSLPIKDRPELTKALHEAVAAYEAMTPEQKLEMRHAQRKSWVIGEMMLSHPDMTREEAERLYMEVGT